MDLAKLYVNGVLVYTWPWHYTSYSTSGTNQLGAVDFFAGGEGSDTPKFFIDDVEYITTPPPAGSCDWRIDLYDHYGDGWNGGSLDVLVDGVVRLDNITLASGSGPLSYYFPVNTGAQVTTVFTSGSWAYECYYYIYNTQGVQMWLSDGYGSYVPPPDILPGQLYGNCITYGNLS